MELIDGRCPKCKEKLQLPKDRESVHCMYCGEQISIDEAVFMMNTQTMENQRDYEDERDYEEYYVLAKKELPYLIGSMIEEGMNSFKRNTYESAFQSYMQTQSPGLESVYRCYQRSMNKEELLKEMANIVIEDGVKELKSITKERKREQRIMDYNMILVVYVIPAVLEYESSCSEEFADEILAAWKREFPSTNLQKSTYEKIVGGFRKRLCYITTTVCEYYGKPDDCYELMTLRKFRDNYLLKSEKGSQLVKEYYDIAPTIVKRLKEYGNQTMYERLYQTYIVPCLRFIENEKYEECTVHYEEMVNFLRKELFPQRENVA